MNLSVAFSPLLPAWLAIALAAVGALLLAFGFARRVRGTWVRALALIALVLALFNPILLREERDPLSTVVAVVVDKSASQSLDGRTERTEAARAALAERFAGLDGIELRTIEAGTAPRTDGTELFSALRAGLADVPPDRIGGAILLTDGQVHDVPDTAAELGGAPLHALLTGREDEIDRRVAVEEAPRFGIVGEDQQITYRVLDEGVPSPGPVRVTVSLDGVALSVETVQAGDPATFTFELPHGGENIVELAAEPLAGELTGVNNSAVVQITGIRENLRVLLVSGEPHAGERTWRNLLKSDASVDLVHFTILRPPEKQDNTPINQLSLIAFPTRELFSTKINEFDLIIFDRYQHRGVLPVIYFDNIARYVRDGGAVLIAAGPDDAGRQSIYETALADILPAAPTGAITEEPYFAEVTEQGHRHPVTRDLEGAEFEPPHWSRWFRLIDAAEPNGDVIMQGPDEKPLLVLGHEGEGRVALLLSDQAWLWARGYEGGGPHVDLLRRLAHWLMKEPDLEEEALRARAEGPDLVVERQTMADTIEPVTVRAPSGAARTLALTEVEPGLWRAIIPADEIGLWRAEQGDKVAVAHVGPPNPREFVDARSTPEKLAPLVEATAGHSAFLDDGRGGLDIPRIVPIRSGDNFSGNDWMGVRVTEASVLLGIDRLPLFAGFLGLALLLGAVAATWFREGR